MTNNTPLGFRWQPGQSNGTSIPMDRGTAPSPSVTGGPSATKVLQLNLPSRAAPNQPVPQELLQGTGGAGAANLPAILRMLQQAMAPQGPQAAAGPFSASQSFGPATALSGGGAQPLSALRGLGPLGALSALSSPPSTPRSGPADWNSVASGVQRVRIGLGAEEPRDPGPDPAANPAIHAGGRGPSDLANWWGGVSPQSPSVSPAQLQIPTAPIRPLNLPSFITAQFGAQPLF